MPPVASALSKAMQIAANPISFLIDGKQHVAIAAGHSLYVFGLPQ